MRELVRRLSYDLTGLPPDETLLKSIPNEFDQNFYTEIVERWINSYAFGERFTSMWLNLARYAEDQAHQVGNDTKYFYPNAYKYRQWVIDAFNQDLPYDTFIRLQLAADLIPDREQDDIKALGFLGLGPKYYNRGRIEVKADEWEDRVDTVTRSFLGLTVACARCHDHKYDPITIEDYYSLAGVFASTDMVNQSLKEDGSTVSDAEKKSRQFEIHVVKEGRAQNLPVFKRGVPTQKGLETPRRFLRVLSDGPAQPFTQGSGRLELANLIAAPSNPLTARVYVNRIWGMMMGKPLVSSESNYGELGMKPTHQNLLDDLSTRFMDHGWSTKWLVREIVYSAAYQQTSASDSQKLNRDPENQMMSRMNRKKLTVEMWRDAGLILAGLMDGRGGKSKELNDPQNHQRTVYSRISRLSLNSMLMQFDYPDANVHNESRSETITPTQKLYALNDPFFLKLAESFAQNLSKEIGNNPTLMIRHAFKQIYFRDAREDELSSSISFIVGDKGLIEMERFVQFCHALLISNEMLYID